MTAGAAPILIDYLRPRDWRQLARAAALLDISAGEDFDVRAGAINLWAGPDDKPVGWPPEVPVTTGDLRHPHAYVGTLLLWGDASADWATDTTNPVLLGIRIGEVAAWRLTTAPGTWRPDDPELARMVDDEAWCRRQWQRLKEFAEVPAAACNMPRAAPVAAGGAS